MSARWTVEEIGIVVLDYPFTPAKVLAAKLGRTEKSIHLMAWKRNVKRLFHVCQKSSRGKYLLKESAA